MVDTAKIIVKAGDGGDGLVSFLRAKYVPKGGPNGGDGGKGGDIIISVDPNLNSLHSFSFNKVYKADNGQNGGKENRTGKNGQDVIIKVPAGTLVYKDQHLIADLTNQNPIYVIDRGGKGGLGNIHFKSSTNQAPVQNTLGEKKHDLELSLELKLLADVGIIGLPSAGKTSLLNSISKSHAKVGSYDFTTLEPNLGIIYFNQYIQKPIIDRAILADIPGLIEGASEGKGLGHDFLRHIERTNILLHVIDGSKIENSSVKELLNQYEVVRTEISKWNKNILNKTELILINKVDLEIVANETESIKKAFNKHVGTNPIFISTFTHEGVHDVIINIYEALSSPNYKENIVDIEPEKKIFNIYNLKNRRIIFRKTDSYPLKAPKHS